MIIAEKCYSLIKQFPKEENYGMSQQIRRAAISIPANIAEFNDIESIINEVKEESRMIISLINKLK
jgi:hypothetical protein